MKAPDAGDSSLGWLNRYVPTSEGQRRYARELGMLAATAALHNALKSAGLSQKEIADKLGKSKGFVSRALNGQGNLTIGTITDILWACGKEWHAVELRELGAPRSQTIADVYSTEHIANAVDRRAVVQVLDRVVSKQLSVHASAGSYEATAAPMERLTRAANFATAEPPAAESAAGAGTRRHLQLLRQDAA
jgi:hypothetical protein